MSPPVFRLSRAFSYFLARAPRRSDVDPCAAIASPPASRLNEKSLDRAPECAYDKGEASPTGTLTPSAAIGLDSLPYQSSASPSTLISRVASKTSEDVSAPSAPPAIPRATTRLWAAFLIYVCIGWSDGVTGTILPYFQSDFSLSYTQTSLLFITSAIGILSGTFSFEFVYQRMGNVDVAHRSSFPTIFGSLRRFRSTKQHSASSSLYFSDSRARYFALLFGILVHACWFVMMGSKRGYVCLLLAFVVSGIGRAFMFGVLNCYVAALPTKPLGQLHGSWGIGGFCSPLVAQALISRGIDWHVFYLISIAWSALAFTVAVTAFRPTREEHAGELAAALSVALPSADNAEKGLTDVAKPMPTRPRSTLLICLKTPLVLAFCAFLFVYSGSETSANGFFVTYLLRERHANPKVVGYFGSVFWAGFTIARLAVGFWAPRHSYRAGKYLEHCLIFNALCWNLCIWLVASLPANIVFVGLVGFSDGPMFPLTVSLATMLLPTELHMVGISLLSASASFGSAILPFISGVLSNNPKIGLDVLPKMLVAEACILLVAWYFFPSTTRQRST